MKETYINQVLTTITALAQSIGNAETLVNAYFDRGYGSGGANEITADDLAAAGLTVGQLASAITLFQQLQLLRSGSDVTPGDYDATLNQLRRDI